jgi:hypothetical protein
MGRHAEDCHPLRIILIADRERVARGYFFSF